MDLARPMNPNPLFIMGCGNTGKRMARGSIIFAKRGKKTGSSPIRANFLEG